MKPNGLYLPTLIIINPKSIIDIYPMYKPILVLTLVVLSTSLLTSTQWQKRGINVKDGLLQEPYLESVAMDTVCNKVDLTANPYNYNGTVRSGYLKVGKGNSVLSFIFYGKQNTTDVTKVPTIIWLNGGPGSSSQFGNLFQLGPFFVRTAHMAPYEIVRNNYTWAKEYNLLFVDQPVGTGLSYADPDYKSPNNKSAYCTSMEEVANDFWFALKELYSTSNGCFQQLGISPSQDLFIFGESYAGKYVPAIAEKIKKEQQDNNGFLTGLRGIAIGDGFTNPHAILTEVGEYAYNLGLIDYQERSLVEQYIMNSTYQDRIRAWRDLHDTFEKILDFIVERAGNINVYDITKYHDYPDIIISEYLKTESTKKLFSLKEQLHYDSQSGNVYEAMYEDFMKPYVHLVEELLRRKVHILVYNGQNDLIVETPGTFKWVERLYFAASSEFREKYFSVWKVDGKTAGYHKSAGYLELRTVNNAGHMVPMDQGAASLHMVNVFVKKCLENKSQ